METPDLLHPLAAPFRYHEDRDDVVLLLHGWTGSPAHLRLIAEDLVQAGYGAVAPLLPGHGTEIEHMLAHGWRDWVRAAAEPAAEVESRGARLHVAGLSMGGLLAILLAAVFDVTSLTTINAPIRVFDRRVPLSFLVRGTRRIVEQEDPERPLGFAVDHDHGYRDSPIGTVADLYLLMRSARRALPKVTAPTFVIQGRADETVRHESAGFIYERAGSPYKRLLWLEESAHVATLDVERVTLARELVRHLGEAKRMR